MKLLAFCTAGSQPGATTEGPQAALESLKKALELPSETPGARRLSTPSKARRARGMAVVVLDEMDQLLSQDHSVLYDLFRLPQASTSDQMPGAQIPPPCTYAPACEEHCTSPLVLLSRTYARACQGVWRAYETCRGLKTLVTDAGA